MNSNLPPLEEEEIETKVLKRQNRRSFLWGGTATIFTIFGIGCVLTMENERGLPWLLRRLGDLNDSFWNARLKKPDLVSPATPDGKPFRVNGDVGLEAQVDEKSWRLQVDDPGLAESLSISLEQIRQLPDTKMSFEFKCIEGWSQSIECRGVRVSDFMTHFNIGTKSESTLDKAIVIPYEYTSLVSVNGGYYVSMDAKSLWHPQTLLCYEINGEALTPEHGGPVRIMTAVKYGVKSIKQLGRMQFADSPPADYWAERGYLDKLMF